MFANNKYNLKKRKKNEERHFLKVVFKNGYWALFT